MDYPDGPNEITRVFIGKEGDRRVREDVMTDAQSGVTRGHEPRNAGGA